MMRSKSRMRPKTRKKRNSTDPVETSRMIAHSDGIRQMVVHSVAFKPENDRMDSQVSGIDRMDYQISGNDRTDRQQSSAVVSSREILFCLRE